ncbi:MULTISPECIES: hypothetical protein [Bacillus]|nr:MULTISPECIES: hypothetical protein [Bacillus]AJE78349.1 hypothetical protein OY17_09695 [Bacillus sp. BH072]AUG35432.1 hypothetical protein CXP43_06720 [Bacillus velezensis]KFI16381.1 hypothetical protein IO97_07390 [Bacillus velezensis]KOC83113.1 hypothetical protein AKJ10_06700 [Bacillus velezensis]KSV98605.1 hypothetical protein AR443_10025 [Bacillus velezensis]
MSNTTSRLSPDCLSGGVYITEDLRKSYPSREAAADRGFSIWALRFAGIFSITGSVFMGAGNSLRHYMGMRGHFPGNDFV